MSLYLSGTASIFLPRLQRTKMYNRIKEEKGIVTVRFFCGLCFSLEQEINSDLLCDQLTWLFLICMEKWQRPGIAQSRQKGAEKV